MVLNAPSSTLPPPVPVALNPMYPEKGFGVQKRVDHGAGVRSLHEQHDAGRDDFLRELAPAGEPVVHNVAGFQLRPFCLVKSEVAEQLPSQGFPVRALDASAPGDATGSSSSMSTTAAVKEMQRCERASIESCYLLYEEAKTCSLAGSVCRRPDRIAAWNKSKSRSAWFAYASEYLAKAVSN